MLLWAAVYFQLKDILLLMLDETSKIPITSCYTDAKLDFTAKTMYKTSATCIVYRYKSVMLRRCFASAKHSCEVV